MSPVIHLTEDAFEKATAQSAPILIDFWASSGGREPRVGPAPTHPLRRLAAPEPRCGPCRMQGPILDEVARTVGAQAIVAKVNADEEPFLAARFGVQSIPTLVLLKGGRIQQRMVGLRPVHVLVEALQQVVA
jgi:thioredoxin-like negative regulator of GroEL